jgi:hypothetical protein
MCYIVIEIFGGANHAIVVTDEDGNNQVFDDKQKAIDYADNECQEGIVLEID